MLPSEGQLTKTPDAYGGQCLINKSIGYGVGVFWSEGSRMQAKYTRLFVDDRGGSCFEDLATELQPDFCPPGMSTPGFSAPFLATDGSFWVGAPNAWKDDTPHTAPRRMILVTTQGEYAVTTSDGNVRRFPADSVVVLRTSLVPDIHSKLLARRT
jgi:hypothetical protein